MQFLGVKGEPHTGFLMNRASLEAEFPPLEVPEEEDPTLPLVLAVPVGRAHQVFVELYVAKREIWQGGPSGFKNAPPCQTLALQGIL